MACYLITYDLHDPARENDVLAYVQAGSYARVANSSYAVLSNKTAEMIRDELSAIARTKITVYVFPVGRPYAGLGAAEINNWLEQNVPRY